MIYFLLNPENLTIKIGYTEQNIDSRLSNLQIGSCNKLMLVAFVAGDRKVEKMLHGKFKHLHVNGEWFSLKSELRDFVTMINKDAEYMQSFVVDELRRQLENQLKHQEDVINNCKTELESLKEQKVKQKKVNNVLNVSCTDEVIIQTALLQTKPFTLVTIADQLNVSHTKRRIFFKYAKKVLEENTLLRYPEKQTRYKGERGYWWQPVLINEGVINGNQN